MPSSAVAEPRQHGGEIAEDTQPARFVGLLAARSAGWPQRSMRE